MVGYVALVQQVNPIAGLSIAFLSIFISFSIMFAAMFIYKWLKAPVRNVRDTRLFWAFLMIAFAFQQLFFMINDFFIAALERSIWIYLGYGAAAIGLTLFVMIQETTLPFKTHGALTLINFILFAILFTAPLEFQVIFALILTVFYASILVVFARYITKKITGELSDNHYSGRLPEYCTSSKSIGLDWYKKFKTDLYPDDFVVINGSKQSIPKYYDQQLDKTDPQLLQKLKSIRRQSQLKSPDNTLKRLDVRLDCKLAATKTLKRSLEQ